MSTLNLADDVVFVGPALPEAFVRHDLEKMLGPLLPKAKPALVAWQKYRQAIRQPLTLQSGRFRVKNVVLDMLAALTGYDLRSGESPVQTREGAEGPGFLLTQQGVSLRAFTHDYQGDLDAPFQQGMTYRHTPQRIAERILNASHNDCPTLL